MGTKTNSYALMQSKGKSVGTSRLGKLYVFKYLATEDQTPYYDMFPTSLIIGKHIGGFSGINFNYIDHENRKELMAKINNFFTVRSGQRFFEFKQFKAVLGNRAYRAALVCVRNYKHENLKSPLIEVDDSIWEETIERCDEMFVKVNPTTKSRSLVKSELVWRNSLKQIRGNI